MIYYLDTSAFVAWFDPCNPHCRRILAWRERQRAGVVPTYNRMVQLEARHYLRRLTHEYAAVAWNAFRAFEGARLFEWQRLDFSSLFERAEDLSASHESVDPMRFLGPLPYRGCPQNGGALRYL